MPIRSARSAKVGSFSPGSHLRTTGRCSTSPAGSGQRKVLELRELVKRYPVGGDDDVAVNGVSLSVAAGELVALYGPSGSGKTTLMMMAAAVQRPDSGAVFFDNREVSAFRSVDAARYRMQDLGFVRQSLDLIPGATALENAALKLIGERKAREAHRLVEPLLARLGLGERLGHRA